MIFTDRIDLIILQMWERNTPEKEIAKAIHTTEEKVKERLDELEKREIDLLV